MLSTAGIAGVAEVEGTLVAPVDMDPRTIADAVVYTGIDPVSELELKGVTVTVAEASETLDVNSDGSVEKPGVLLAGPVSNDISSGFPGFVVTVTATKHSSRSVSSAPEPSLVL